jgi:hypothetical protein
MLSGTREKHVSRISVGRYVRPFVWNNHYIVCDCNRIGGVARDDNLPQHLASASQAEPLRLALARPRRCQGFDGERMKRFVHPLGPCLDVLDDDGHRLTD